MAPRLIARRLIDLAAKAEPIEILVDGPQPTWGQIRDYYDEYGIAQRLVRPAEQLLKELDRALADAGRDTDVSSYDEFNEEQWTFGSAIRMRGPRLNIHRGFLDSIRSIPILASVPDRLATYLITIKDGDDYLKRERHGSVGWHYHYLDWADQRSNVILCWDTRWERSAMPCKPPKRRGLFVEKHAEGGKPFKAHPGAWADRKRESMYEACDADLLSQNIKEYRCAANKSKAVYPLDATLTPHASSDVPAKPTGGQQQKKDRV